MSTPTPASTRKTDFFLLYYVVKEYLNLEYPKRFKVGIRMGLINFTHAAMEPEELDEFVVRKMLKQKQLDQFVRIMQVIRHEPY